MRLVATIVTAAALLANIASVAQADGTEHLEHMDLVLQAPCTVDTESNAGFCQLWTDDEGMDWLVFYDRPKNIKWIRTGTGGEYHYIYQTMAGEPV